jgi:type IV pilus assembly protein PilB
VPPVRKKLGDILVEMGVLDAQQLRAGLGHHQQWGMPLGQALVERQLCSPIQVLEALSRQTGVALVDLDAVELSPTLTSALPLKVAKMARAVPLEVQGARSEVLVVAVAAPASLQTLDLVRAGSGKARIVPKLATDDAIERAIGRLYLGVKPEPKTEPAAAPVLATEVQSEQLFELEREPPSPAPSAVPIASAPAPGPASVPQPAAAPARPGPVLLFGWSEEVAAALEATLRGGGVEARTAAEDAVLGCGAEDVVVTSTLSLEMVLGSGQRLRGRVIVCGMPESTDMLDARALGAHLYLAPPFSSAQLVEAIRHSLGAPSVPAMAS